MKDILKFSKNKQKCSSCKKTKNISLFYGVCLDCVKKLKITRGNDVNY
jgi:Zn finger protein HypA/HybF involved in hydrogenase expression